MDNLLPQIIPKKIIDLEINGILHKGLTEDDWTTLDNSIMLKLDVDSEENVNISIKKPMNSMDRKIAMKMSKSKPETAIFMTDTREEILEKFRNAYCPESEDDNPVLEYAKYIVFQRFNEIIIERPIKFGGLLKVKNYDELKKLYINKKIHPLDLKNTIADYIDKLIEPVREHFVKNKAAAKLLKQVKSF